MGEGSLERSMELVDYSYSGGYTNVVEVIRRCDAFYTPIDAGGH